MKILHSFWLGLALVAGTALADPVKIKLGTLAPKDSSPHNILKTMAEAWRKAPNGGAQLIMFTDGTQGGELDMVRRMKIGQLQAAMLTAGGLAEIDDSVTCLQMMPLVFRSLEELDYVTAQMRPTLEKRLAEKGFIVLFWADAGWVRFFSREPALVPEDLRRQKLFAGVGDSKAINIMKAAGYHPIPLEATDILPGLQTGLIDVVAAPPFFALAGQFYGPAPHMLDMNWVPLVGATIVSKKTWDKIPAEDQKLMLAAATKAGAEVRAQARKEMVESVDAMKKRGLMVQELTPEASAVWHKLAEDTYSKIRGTIVPADLFDEVLRLLAEYRAKS